MKIGLALSRVKCKRFNHFVFISVFQDATLIIFLEFLLLFVFILIIYYFSNVQQYPARLHQDRDSARKHAMLSTGQWLIFFKYILSILSKYFFQVQSSISNPTPHRGCMREPSEFVGKYENYFSVFLLNFGFPYYATKS